MSKKKTSKKRKDIEFPTTLNDPEVKIRITAMIDGDVRHELKKRADEQGTKYQTLLNSILREHLFNEKSLATKVEFLEKEVSKIQKQLKKVS